MRPATVPPGIHPATGEPVIRDGVLDRMAGDLARAQAAPLLCIRFKHVYGNVMCYPVCQNAIEFARIARTKTLSPEVVASARRLGFQLKLVDGSFELLTEYLRGQP